MKLSFCVILSLGLGIYANAQSNFKADEKEVLAVIEQLFDGMRKGDSSLVSDVFMPDVLLHTIATDPEGNRVFNKGRLESFLVAVGTPHNQVWDEPIWNTKIQVDGNLAQVWTDYAFYVGETFSHCGVDAFTLYKTENGWKVFQLADTRRKQNCHIPAHVIKE